MNLSQSAKTIASTLVKGLSSLASKRQENLRNRVKLEELDPLKSLKSSERAKNVPVVETVPWSLRVGAAWSWRFLVVVGALVVLAYTVQQLTIVVVPVLVALLMTILLEPIMRLLYIRLGLPRTLSAVLTLLTGMGLLFGMLSLATSQIVQEISSLVDRVQDGVKQSIHWLRYGPLQWESIGAAEGTLTTFQKQITQWMQEHVQFLATNALGTVSTLTTMMAGFITAVFCLFFFLKDGRKIWQWFLRLCPQQARNPLNEAGIRGWVTLGAYGRAQMIVAAIDATGIGLGAYFIGVPLALPLAVIVFIFAFIPILGAIISGFIAVMVALVDQGVTTAIIMLVIILVVQQIESNLLQPALMSNAVNLHPVAVFLIVTAGGYVAGITGAVFSVPILAFINTVVLYLKGYDKFIYLNYQQDRPGGAPGTLEAEIAESLRPSEENLDSARRAKEQAEASRNNQVATDKQKKISSRESSPSLDDSQEKKPLLAPGE